MSMNELQLFLSLWDQESKQTEKLLAALPGGKQDFRPHPGARTLGELAWHLAEIDGHVANEVPDGEVTFRKAIPELEPPRKLEDVAAAYRRVRDQARANLARMDPARLDRQIPFMGRPYRAGDVLWGVLLHHHIHHRGQLQLCIRLAGGTPTGVYGPTLEESAVMQQRTGTASGS